MASVLLRRATVAALPLGSRRLATSSGAAPLTVSIDQATRSAKIVMHGAQSNAVTVELLKSLHGALDTIEADRGLRGLVLTSSVEKYFSVGISLDVFTSSNEVQWRQFWSDVRNFFIRVHNSRLISVAAINGHAPGAGTIFALACHHRLMLRNGTRLGLNEVAVGLPVPHWLCDRMAQVCGHRNAERLLPMGATIPADQAVQVGLVDRAFDTAAEMDAAAAEILSESRRLAVFPQHKTMSYLHESYTKAFNAERELDIDQSWVIVSSPEFQTAVKGLQAKLAAGKASASPKPAKA